MTVMSVSYAGSESQWREKQQETFDKLVQKMDSYTSASQQLLFVMLILLDFMSNYFGGESQAPAAAMNDIANVDMYDTQYIESVYEQVAGSQIGNTSYNYKDDPRDDPNYKIVQEAYEAADNLLLDVYTNPIFAGTSIPGQVLSNLEGVFGNASDISWETVQVTVGGETTSVSVPYWYYIGGNNKEVIKTMQYWEGIDTDPDADNTGDPYQPGEDGYAQWAAKMQGSQSNLQEVTTILTNDSASQQTEEQFYVKEEKLFLGTWGDIIKDYLSQNKTDLTAQVRG